MILKVSVQRQLKRIDTLITATDANIQNIHIKVRYRVETTGKERFQVHINVTSHTLSSIICSHPRAGSPFFGVRIQVARRHRKEVTKSEFIIFFDQSKPCIYFFIMNTEN